MTDTEEGTMGAWTVTLETESAAGFRDAEGWSYRTESEALSEAAAIYRGMADDPDDRFGEGVRVRVVVEYDPTDDEFTG